MTPMTLTLPTAPTPISRSADLSTPGPRVVAIEPDLLTASRLEGPVNAAGGTFTRVDHPECLPAASMVDLLLVDWADREPNWGADITAWRDADPLHRPRVVLFGPHADLAAHAAARAIGLGPMRARSAVVSNLADLLTSQG